MKISKNLSKLDYNSWLLQKSDIKPNKADKHIIMINTGLFKCDNKFLNLLISLGLNFEIANIKKNQHPLRQLAFIFILTLGHGQWVHAAAGCLGGASTGFKLGGALSHPKSFTPTSLSQYQSSKMTVTFFSGSAGLVTKTFVGVPLYDLITEAGVMTDSTRKNDILRKYLIINATDCYQVIVAVAEILPATGGQQAMVAFATVDETGAIVPLDDTEGSIRLIMPGDKTGGRDVFHLNGITVRSAP